MRAPSDNPRHAGSHYSFHYSLLWCYTPNMNVDASTYWAIGKVLLPLIVKLARFVASWRKLSEERLEKLEVDILDYLARRREWTTPGLVWADLILLPILKDVRFDDAFPSELDGWAKFKWRLRIFRLNARNRWRVWRQFIPESVITRIVRRLWKEKQLDRAWWDELYRIRF